MTRKLLVLSGVVVAMMLWTTLALAGDWHVGSTLVCSDCHIMHASQSHDYSPGVAPGSVQDFDPSGHEFLLRKDINALCLTCHDGKGGVPDVLEQSSNPYVRQAGALNMDGGNDYFHDTGHTLGSMDVAPGGAFADSTHGLNCVNCHAAHGAGGVFGPGTWDSYRNLGGYGTAAAYGFQITRSSGAVNPGTEWVHQDLNAGTVEGHYGVAGVTFNEPVATESKYADFCKFCHQDFHGDAGGLEVGGEEGDPGKWDAFIRHPASTVNIGALTGGHSSMSTFADSAATNNRVQVMSPDGVKPADYPQKTNLTPSCMSCHKAHGNKNSFGLIYMSGTGAISEEGDDGTQSRDLCKQCHVQGG